MDNVLAARMAGIEESATLALNAQAKKLTAEGKTVYNLTAGELATDTPDYIQMAVKEKLKFNKYTPVAGLPELRQAIADNARDFYGLEWIEPANVVATAGVKPGLFAALLATVNQGDEVLVPVPAWTTTYKPLVELAGGTLVEVPLTGEFDLDPKALQAKLSDTSKVIILNTPNNPTGAVFSKQALEQVADLLKDRNIIVIADDIYAKLIYDDTFVPVPTIGFQNLIIVNGFSKSQALTGWRIGYVIADSEVAQAITTLLSHITGNAPLPSQYAALAAIEQHDDQPPASTIEALVRQRQLAVDSIRSIPGLACSEPGGAFYLFIDVRGITDDSAAWCARLLDSKQVALIPGEVFSAPGFVRLTFVTDESTLTEALGKIKEFVKEAA